LRIAVANHAWCTAANDLFPGDSAQEKPTAANIAKRFSAVARRGLLARWGSSGEMGVFRRDGGLWRDGGSSGESGVSSYALAETDTRQIAGQIPEEEPPAPRTDRTDEQIGGQDTVLKAKSETTNLSVNLSDDLSDAPNLTNLSNRSDLSGPSGGQKPADDFDDIPHFLDRRSPTFGRLGGN
jgi:hypothetical protein